MAFIVIVALHAAAMISLTIGFALYKTVLLPFTISFKALELIEAKTASGGIGILAFSLFFLGSLIHIWLKLDS